jgi:murein L,D-transpeptidase YcbB/YkuD
MRHAAGLVAIAGIGCALLSASAQGGDLPVAPLAWDSAALDGMVRATAAYQRLVNAKSWPTVPDGPSMRPDMIDARVPVLRRRLAATGDMPPGTAAGAGDRVDPALVAAVGRFQSRHGLIVDGIAGRRTVELMNVAAAERARQLMVNDDRLRALARTLPATGVVVNVPAATAQLMVGGRVALTSRVIVGERTRPTPLLESAIGAIVLNPGPLGGIEFTVPDDPHMSLQGVPSRRPFLRPDRALSDGCIRIERAFDLALRLLAGNSDWTAESLRAAIDTGHRQTVMLARPVPIRTVYVTAWVAADGTAQFRPDIYGRDAAGSAGRPEAKSSPVPACSIAPPPSSERGTIPHAPHVPG